MDASSAGRNPLRLGVRSFVVDDFLLRGKAPVTFGRKSLMLSSRARKAAGSTIVAHLVSRITACQGGTVEFRVLDDRHVREAMVARPKPRDVYKNERLVACCGMVVPTTAWRKQTVRKGPLTNTRNDDLNPGSLRRERPCWVSLTGCGFVCADPLKPRQTP